MKLVWKDTLSPKKTDRQLFGAVDPSTVDIHIMVVQKIQLVCMHVIRQAGALNS